MDEEKLKRKAKIEKLKELRKLMLKKMVGKSKEEDSDISVDEEDEESSGKDKVKDEDFAKEIKEFMRKGNSSSSASGKTKVIFANMAKSEAPPKAPRGKRS